MLSSEEFYLEAYEKYGICARGVSWYSEDFQKIRFEIITHFLKDELSKSSIVDAGCGFGDLFLYWENLGLKTQKYIGIDALNHAIKISKKRLKKFPNCFVESKDILKDELPYADWYVASGSLNVLSSFDTWLFLEKMLIHSKKGIVFNILEGTKKSDVFNYQKKEDIISFAKKKGLKVRIIEEYINNDISVEIKK